jgi:hypothetical protein
VKHPITRIRVFFTWETCERHTFYVELTTAEGFTMTPQAFATGSVYTNGVGLSIDEARDRALITAHDWADFLGVPVDEYADAIGGSGYQVYEPSRKLNIYETRRKFKARQETRHEEQ